MFKQLLYQCIFPLSLSLLLACSNTDQSSKFSLQTEGKGQAVSLNTANSELQATTLNYNANNHQVQALDAAGNSVSFIAEKPCILDDPQIDPYYAELNCLENATASHLNITSHQDLASIPQNITAKAAANAQQSFNFTYLKLPSCDVANATDCNVTLQNTCSYYQKAQECNQYGYSLCSIDQLQTIIKLSDENINADEYYWTTNLFRETTTNNTMAIIHTEAQTAGFKIVFQNPTNGCYTYQDIYDPTKTNLNYIETFCCSQI